MPFILLIAFIAVPLAEIALLVKVGQHIGLLWTILIVILTAVIGTTLLRQQGFGVLSRATEALAAGRMPVETVIEGLFLLISGAFLLTPGLLTDTVGFLFLVPPIRMAIAKWTLKKLLASGAVHVSGFGMSGSAGQDPADEPDDRRPPPRGSGTVIEGDYERVDEHTIRPDRNSRRS